MKWTAKACVFGLGLMASWSTAFADGELNIYNWGDYTNPKLIEKFEKQYNIKVTMDDYDSNETMLSKVRAGNSGYDIVVPSDYIPRIQEVQASIYHVMRDAEEALSRADG